MLEGIGSKQVACSKCNELKPWPVDFITSFNKGTTESICAACRKIRRKEIRKKCVGSVELKGGWRNKDNEYHKRSCATARRILKEKNEN